METSKCQLIKQGRAPGSCLVKVDGKRRPACQATLKYEKEELCRLIISVHLSRPENYYSIYQSGCNFSCRKCHSWYFSKVWNGSWYTPEDILKKSMQYEKLVNLEEPRERATAWHAQETCRCCGTCVTYGWRSSTCPDILDREAILLVPRVSARRGTLSLSPAVTLPAVPSFTRNVHVSSKLKPTFGY